MPIISDLPYVPTKFTPSQRKTIYARHPNAPRKPCRCGCGRDFPEIPEFPNREFFSPQCWKFWTAKNERKEKAKQPYVRRPRTKQCAGDGCETMIPERSTRCGSCAAKYRAEQRHGKHTPYKRGAGAQPLMPSFEASAKLTRGIVAVVMRDYEQGDEMRRDYLRRMNPDIFPSAPKNAGKFERYAEKHITNSAGEEIPVVALPAGVEI